MANQYYKKSDILNSKYYKVPSYIKADFSNIEFKEIVLHDGDRLDIIAHQLYGNPSHWRAIALFNDLSYFFELKAGDILRLPINIQEVLSRI